jgi:hypothetical protein
MTIRELQKELGVLLEKHGDKILDYDVYLEQCHEEDKVIKRTSQKWDILVDSEEWEYFKSVGGCAFWDEKKALMICVNY